MGWHKPDRYGECYKSEHAQWYLGKGENQIKVDLTPVVGEENGGCHMTQLSLDMDYDKILEADGSILFTGKAISNKVLPIEHVVWEV